MEESMSRSGLAAWVALSFLMGSWGGAIAEEQEEKKTGWFDAAEVGLAFTDGNSETESINFDNKLWRVWEKARFNVDFGGLRAATAPSPYAVGDPPTIVRPDPVTTAEKYYFRTEYRRQIHERFYWFGGAGWDRNSDAGIDNRYSVYGGVGNVWWGRDDLKFSTEYGVSYTDQEDEIPDPRTDDTYLGLRLAWKYLNQFGKVTTYTNDFEFFGNGEDSDAWRFNMDNKLTVAMSKKLALSVGLVWLYNNVPALKEIPLFDVDPSQGGIQIGTLAIPSKKWDTIFTVNLVLKF
jgi:putative salt-induced outer membrane protein YdiY